MARAHHVKKARKDYLEADIKKGDSYWWWAFNFGPKVKSKNKPRRSQLTQSWFYAAMWDIEDDFGDATAPRSGVDFDDLMRLCNDAASNVREQGDECQEKLDNMPMSLQDSDSGCTLRDRIEQCETIASLLEQASDTVEGLRDGEEPLEERWDDAIDALGEIDWSYD